MLTEQYTLPSHWASAFINSDLTGYDESDISEMEYFIAHNQKEGCSFYCLSVSEDHWFAWSNDANCLGADVSTFTFDVSPITVTAPTGIF